MDKMFDGEDGKSYTTATLMSVIDAEDALEGKTSSTSGRKKSKHCVPRLAELLIDDRLRHRIAASRTQLSKAELDRKDTGKTRSINIDLWNAFKDRNFKVSTDRASPGTGRSMIPEWEAHECSPFLFFLL